MRASKWWWQNVNFQVKCIFNEDGQSGTRCPGRGVSGDTSVATGCLVTSSFWMKRKKERMAFVTAVGGKVSVYRQTFWCFVSDCQKEICLVNSNVNEFCLHQTAGWKKYTRNKCLLILVGYVRPVGPTSCHRCDIWVKYCKCNFIFLFLLLGQQWNTLE